MKIEISFSPSGRIVLSVDGKYDGGSPYPQDIGGRVEQLIRNEAARQGIEVKE